MESAEFVGVLSDEEVKTLNDEIKTKLQEYFCKTKSDGDIYKGEVLKIKADYEQKCYDLDKKLIETTSRLTLEASKNEKLEKSANDLSVEITSLKEKFEENEKLLHVCQLDNNKLNRVKDSWDGEKLDLQHAVKKKDVEIARLTEEWKVESERLIEATAAKNEYQLKFDEINSQGVDTHYKLNRIEQEKDLLVQQNNELTDNLNKKTNELIVETRSKGNEIISLKTELDLHVSEKGHLTELVSSLKKVEQSLQEKVNELQDKFGKISEEYQSMNQLNRRELQSQTRLADLYKSAAEDAERKSEELISAVQELQGLVQAANEKNVELQKIIDDSQNTYSEQYVEMESLKKELEHANDLIIANKKREINEEELAEMCPTAALTSKFMKSDMTLTQIYSQFVEQTDELFAVKEENKRINEAMDQIVEELNEKAPILKRQREDYDRALATISQLTSQNDEAVVQFQQLRQEADDATRRNAHSVRENERLRKEANDLSKQVQFLIKEAEELRGRRIQMSSSRKYDEKSLLVVNDDGSCNDVSSSSELISNTLVTFKDISELQEQNQKLLAVTRELSEERERSERETVEERTRLLQINLDSARDELERLKEDRERQIAMVEGVVKQRDMYRVLLAQNPDGGFSPSVLNSSLIHDISGSIPGTPLSSKSPIFKSPRGEEKKALLQLQEEYEEYKKDVKANNKIMDEKVNTLEIELSDSKSNCIKLEANVEFMKERCNLNKVSMESANKECDTLRSRNAQLYGLINQHEQKVSNLNSELTLSQETCRKLQNKVENVRSEMDICKRTEDRLTLENSSLLREQRNQTLLLNNLQTMQQSVERQGFEVRTQLNSQVDSQEREIKTLRQKNQDLTLSKQDTLQGLEKQLYAVQKMLESEKIRSDSVSKELAELKSKSEDLAREKSEAEMKLKSVEDRLNRIADGKVSVNEVEPGTSANNGVMVKELRQDIKDKDDRYIALEARFDRARITIDHLKEVSATSEKSLTESNEMNQDLLNSLQSRLSKSNQQQIELEQTIAKLEEENYAIRNEKYKVTGEIEQHTSELSKQLLSVQSELEAAIRRRTEAVSNEQIAREELKQQVAQAEEAKDNYQRQIILHANVMQQLIDLKDKIQNDEGLLEKANSQIRSLEQNISDSSASWSEIESKLNSENEHQKQRIADMEEQNVLLHSQIQTLSSQLVDLRSKTSEPPASSPYKLFQSRDPVAVATEAAEKGDESTQQLINVIKFLRREKQISETKCELFQSEIVRLKHQIQQIENQFKDVQTELKQEQGKVQENVEKLGKMSTLEREVENLSRVKEENSGLKEDKDKLEKEVRDVGARLQKMQNDLSPLQIKNRELSAQSGTLQAEKKALGTEVERWKERVHQMTASPRRLDPEEYKKLMSEKTILTKQVSTLNHELAELKAESSALKGQIRTLEASVQTSKVSGSNLERDLVGKDAQIAKANSDLEEKSQTINRLRRVGRKFKTNYEELLAKQTRENEEKKKDQEKVDAGGDSSASSEALKEAEANVAKATEEKARLQAELSQALESQKTLKTQLSDSEKKVASQGYTQSEVMGENVALKAKVDDMSKTLENSKKQNLEMKMKEKKFGKLLSGAKTQIEKLKKDIEEVTKEKDSLKEEVKKVEVEKKSENDQKVELQTKVEELQRQVLEGRSASVGQGSEVRKSANIRPIPTQRVNQVNPMRVTQRVNQVNPTRTARVMPEPHQDAQDVERSASSSVPSQVASSSTQSSVPVAAIGSPATAFVHPINPTRQQQHHVVSSGTPIPPIPQIVLAQPSMVAQEHHMVESASVVAQPSVLARVTAHVEVTDSEQAVVSSSDDPTAQEEASSSQNVPSSSQISPSPSVTPAVSSAQPEASSSTVRTNMGASSTSGVATGRLFSSGQKRTHDEEETSTVSLASTSSRESQVAPLPKRQRGSPDQSSESVSVVTPSTPGNDEVSQSAVSESQLNKPSKTIIRIARSSNEASRNQIKPDQSSNIEVQGNESAAAESGSVILISDNDSEATSVALRQADQSEPGSTYRAEEEEQEYPEVETTQQDIDSGFSASQSQAEATSSMTPTNDVIGDDVIVLSSESEEEYFEDEQVDEEIDEEVEEDEVEKLEEEEDDLQNDDEAPSTSRQQNWGSNLPLLHIHPPEPMRQRIPIRPAPLTPGIVPSSTDDGDGIVPCTPTLIPVRRHDESYQMVSSPRVPPGGLQPLQFHFDVPAGQNLNSVPGLEMDDNIVDLAGEGDDLSGSVPTTPIPSSSSTVFSNAISNLQDEVNPSTSGNGAVSSSIQEEPETNTEEMDQGLSSQVEIQPSSNLSTNTIRGRRFRIRGAPRSRVRGGGANSPSTSNQP